MVISYSECLPRPGRMAVPRFPGTEIYGEEGLVSTAGRCPSLGAGFMGEPGAGRVRCPHTSRAFPSPRGVHVIW